MEAWHGECESNRSDETIMLMFLVKRLFSSFFASRLDHTWENHYEILFAPIICQYVKFQRIRCHELMELNIKPAIRKKQKKWLFLTLKNSHLF